MWCDDLDLYYLRRVAQDMSKTLNVFNEEKGLRYQVYPGGRTIESSVQAGTLRERDYPWNDNVGDVDAE